MSLKKLTPMLRTWDLRGTIDFYTQILGFRCTGESSEHGWAHLERDSLTIMLSGPNEHEGDMSPAFTGSLYITCDDVDVMWQSVKDRVNVCYPIEDFDYGMREFGIYDNNGYLLQFGTPLPGNEQC